MAANVTIRRWTGSAGGPTKSDITSINTRANAQDAHETADVDNPIQVPESGTNYSYWVNTRLSADSSPSGTIDNIKWFTDGSNNFGTGVGAIVATANTYGQATGETGVSGDELEVSAYGDGEDDLNGAPQNAFDYDSTTPLSVTGSVSNPTTGDFGHFVVYQITVGDTAGPGATTPETFTWRYDET